MSDAPQVEIPTRWKGQEFLSPWDFRAENFMFPEPQVEPSKDYPHRKYYVAVHIMPTPYKDESWPREITSYRGLWRLLEGKLETPREKDWKKHRWKRFKTTQAEFEQYRPALQVEIEAFLKLMNQKTNGILKVDYP